MTNNTPFLQLDFDVPNAVSVLDGTKISQIFPSTAEPAAIRHWLFGTDNPTYTDLIAAAVATKSMTPTLSAGYLTTPTVTPFTQGISSDVADMANETICCVFQHQAWATNATILQCYNGAQNTKGFMLWGSQAAGHYTLSNNGNTTIPWPAGLAAGNWLFAAISITPTAQTVVLGPPTNVTNAARTDIVNVTNNIGFFGPDALTGLGGGIAMNGAEAIIFDKALSANEIAGVYARSKARMAARGVTLL